MLCSPLPPHMGQGPKMLLRQRETCVGKCKHSGTASVGSAVLRSAGSRQHVEVDL